MEEKLEALLYRPAEAFRLTGVGRSTGYYLINSGEWPSIRIGKSIRIPASALHEWIERKLAGNEPEGRASVIADGKRR